MNNPVLGDFGTGPRNAVRADLRRAESGESGAHACPNPNTAVSPAYQFPVLDSSISRIRIVPEAGDRAWKAAASRFRLIAAAVR